MKFTLPTSWASFLAKVQTQFPEAVIAGGALRDTIMQKSIKDIDVFVQSRGEITEAMLTIALGSKVKPMNPEWVKDYEEHLTELFAVYEECGYDADWCRFQVIALNMEVTKQSVIDHIDFGICRVAHDGKDMLVTPEFSEDASAHTFTLVHATNIDRSLKRFERLEAEKFNGWKLVRSNG